MESRYSVDDVGLQDCQVKHAPTVSARIIGAGCGAFVLCFIAILISLPFTNGIGELEDATLLWIGALFCGAIGGFAFPRFGHFLAYAFIMFINIMLCLTIGRNIGEQFALFSAFTLSEIVFLMSKDVMRSRQS